MLVGLTVFIIHPQGGGGGGVHSVRIDHFLCVVPHVPAQTLSSIDYYILYYILYQRISYHMRGMHITMNISGKRLKIRYIHFQLMALAPSQYLVLNMNLETIHNISYNVNTSTLSVT